MPPHALVRCLNKNHAVDETAHDGSLIRSQLSSPAGLDDPVFDVLDDHVLFDQPQKRTGRQVHGRLLGVGAKAPASDCALSDVLAALAEANFPDRKKVYFSLDAGLLYVKHDLAPTCPNCIA